RASISVQDIGTEPGPIPAEAAGRPPQASAATDRATLPRDLSLFLSSFSVALSKSTTYPAGHPALTSAVAVVIQRLRTILGSRSGLAIGIARHQLVIEEQETDSGNPILRDLALRLHRHQLAGLHLS